MGFDSLGVLVSTELDEYLSQFVGDGGDAEARKQVRLPTVLSPFNDHYFVFLLDVECIVEKGIGLMFLHLLYHVGNEVGHLYTYVYTPSVLDPHSRYFFKRETHV